MGRTFRVTGIRIEPSANETHDHVGAIRQGTNPQLIGRAVIASDLGDPSGDRYYVDDAGQPLDLVIGDCPICSFPEYLRTTADQHVADRLLALPRV